MKDNNKMICELMGYYIAPNGKEFEFEELFWPLSYFESEWNWLMPCVQVALDMFKPHGLDVENDMHFHNLTSALSDANRESVYSSLVEFLNWYNENK